MIAAAAQADLAVLVVNATTGEVEPTSSDWPL